VRAHALTVRGPRHRTLPRTYYWSGIYLSFVRNAKFTSARTVPLMAFLSNCVVEIYGLDMASAYQHAFVYIRQLAITLRNALHKRTKEAYQTVYNWQFVHSIRVWAKVLGTYCARTRPGGAPDSTSPLVPLIYPLIQVALGTARYEAPAPRTPSRAHGLTRLRRIRVGGLRASRRLRPGCCPRPTSSRCVCSASRPSSTFASRPASTPPSRRRSWRCAPHCEGGCRPATP